MLTPILITSCLIILFSFTFPLILGFNDSKEEYFISVVVSFLFLSLSALPNILLWTGVI